MSDVVVGFGGVLVVVGLLVVDGVDPVDVENVGVVEYAVEVFDVVGIVVDFAVVSEDVVLEPKNYFLKNPFGWVFIF